MYEKEKKIKTVSFSSSHWTIFPSTSSTILTQISSASIQLAREESNSQPYTMNCVLFSPPFIFFLQPPPTKSVGTAQHSHHVQCLVYIYFSFIARKSALFPVKAEKKRKKRTLATLTAALAALEFHLTWLRFGRCCCCCCFCWLVVGVESYGSHNGCCSQLSSWANISRQVWLLVQQVELQICSDAKLKWFCFQVYSSVPLLCFTGSSVMMAHYYHL